MAAIRHYTILMPKKREQNTTMFKDILNEIQFP